MLECARGSDGGQAWAIWVVSRPVGPTCWLFSWTVSDHPLLIHLGATVRSLRQARGWSRRDLAGKAGLSERFLADVEAGRANPSLLRLVGLADALEVSLTVLLAGLPKLEDRQRLRHVALLGLRGAGKSSVGPQVAEALGVRFVELDQRVEAETGLQLSEMFVMHGEDYYRRAERVALERLLAEPQPTVIAVGGGLVVEPESFALLRNFAVTAWLRAEPHDHWHRVRSQGDTRPMADNDKAFTDLRRILSVREPLYRLADATIETSGRSVLEVTEAVVARLREDGAFCEKSNEP